MASVINVKTASMAQLLVCERVHRPHMFGNPFVIGRDGTREQVIAKYRAWLYDGIQDGSFTLDDLKALHGKTLACYCAPLACHADVLVKAAAWASRQ